MNNGYTVSDRVRGYIVCVVVLLRVCEVSVHRLSHLVENTAQPKRNRITTPNCVCMYIRNVHTSFASIP